MATKRPHLTEETKRQVLREAGYRCAVPTCRTILTSDLHHLEYVSEGEGNEASNLLALCPTCHRLHHMGEIPEEAIRVWKGMLVALNHAFDHEAIDLLLFLTTPAAQGLEVSGDGVLRFARLIAAGLVAFSQGMRPGGFGGGATPYCTVWLTDKGLMLVDAWKSGNRVAVEHALAAPLAAE